MAQGDDIVYGYHDYEDDIWMREHPVPSDQMGNLQHSLFDNDFEYWENDDLYW
jgi:hypothetical protein